MKTIIKTSALFFGIALLSTGAFAADKVKEAKEKQNTVVFNSLTAERGVQVIVHNPAAASTLVKIYDEAGNVLLTDALSKKAAVSQKGYDLTQLEEGDYTFQVTTNGEVTKKLVHVYTDADNQRSFFFKQ